MSKYTKKETYYITRKLYNLIRNDSYQIIFKRLWGNIYGYYDGEDIVIDHRKDIIPTLIHECLHCWNEKWSETKVIEHERKIMNSLTPRQIRNIIRMLAKHL